MGTWIRFTAAVLTSGLALYWQPGLENAQYSITSGLGMSGQLVVFVWLSLVYVWAFFGAVAGFAVASATVAVYMRERKNEDTHQLPELGAGS